MLCVHSPWQAQSLWDIQWIYFQLLEKLDDKPDIVAVDTLVDKSARTRVVDLARVSTASGCIQRMWFSAYDEPHTAKMCLPNEFCSYVLHGPGQRMEL
jgi:hypothetical protein